MNWHSGKSGTDAMGYTKDGKTLSNKTDSISEYDDSVDGSTGEDVVYVKKSPIGRSVAKNRGKAEEKILAIDTGGGSVDNPYANSYRGN